jgi:hypothetical protein
MTATLLRRQLQPLSPRRERLGAGTLAEVLEFHAGLH